MKPSPLPVTTRRTQEGDSPVGSRETSEFPPLNNDIFSQHIGRNQQRYKSLISSAERATNWPLVYRLKKKLAGILGDLLQRRKAHYRALKEREGEQVCSLSSFCSFPQCFCAKCCLHAFTYSPNRAIRLPRRQMLLWKRTTPSSVGPEFQWRLGSYQASSRNIFFILIAPILEGLDLAEYPLCNITDTQEEMLACHRYPPGPPGPLVQPSSPRRRPATWLKINLYIATERSDLVKVKNWRRFNVKYMKMARPSPNFP